ncbi:MAG: sigma 54-interacting transcriptional regulator [Labilithrix sp.]|nr:sigma 54-interacting transcriptional regulator [Labilithrix sp.]
MRDSERDILATAVQPRNALKAHAEALFVLTVTEGPERGQSFRLDASAPTRTLVGTSPACEIRLTDNEVSRRHCALERVGGALKVIDLTSTNGTFVDRVKIVEAELQGGEFLRVGSTMFQVETESLGESTVSVPPGSAFGRVVGASREMRRLYPLTTRLAQTTVPVVIEGETGTGKEALAESIHETGPRAAGPFVVFDCTAVPPSLVEAELFGHEQGAFAGALHERKGVFEQAHGGTLLIDEVGDLDPALQPRLLRAIERSEIRRVGGDKWIRVDVRVLAATRRDLDREVQAGRFRDDLFHRLAVARIELPALRNRIGDVSVLATHFWQEMGGDPRAIPRELMQKWEDYGWPGNVRELRNTIARRLALGELADLEPSAPIERGAQADAIDRFVDPALPFPQARDRILDEFEQRYVARLLAMHDGDVARAAAASGIGRRYFQKLKARSKK